MTKAERRQQHHRFVKHNGEAGGSQGGRDEGGRESERENKGGRDGGGGGGERERERGQYTNLKTTRSCVNVGVCACARARVRACVRLYERACVDSVSPHPSPFHLKRTCLGKCIARQASLSASSPHRSVSRAVCTRVGATASIRT